MLITSAKFARHLGSSGHSFPGRTSQPWVKVVLQHTRLSAESDLILGEQPVPEQQQIAANDFRGAFTDLLTETFETVEGNYLDPGTSLFETLSNVEAEEASRSASPKVATLAAQVDHVTYYLYVLERHLRAGGHDETLKSDWGAAWDRTSVTSGEWAEINRGLRSAYGDVQQVLAENTNWQADVIAGFLAILAHTAYHLGEIRQALGVIRA